MKLCSATVLALISATSHAAQFQGITAAEIAASLPYRLSNPIVSVTTMSGDGATIGGSLRQTGVDLDCAAFDCATFAFVWSHVESGGRSLGELSLSAGAQAYPKTVSALSFDGSTSLVTYEYRHYEAALAGDGAVSPLRDPIAIGDWLLASDMAADTSIVVGSLGGEPFRWSEPDSFEGFAGIAPDSGYRPTAISADGSTTVLSDASERRLIGFGVFGSGGGRNPIRWTASEGAMELPPLQSFARADATAVSSGGSVVVGNSLADDWLSSEPSRATVWIDSQPSPLPVISGTSTALAVSADGRSIVGSASSYSPFTDAYFVPEAVLWRDGSAHVLHELLTNEYGLGDELRGWGLRSATAISDDGMVIAGQGVAPDGSHAAWVAILSAPEPGGCLLVITATIAVAFAAGGRRKRPRILRVAQNHCKSEIAWIWTTTR